MNMKPRFISIVLPLIAFLGLLAALGFVQGEERLDGPAVNKLINGLGYETKVLVADPGKEKYEFKVTRGGLDIPIAAEVSASKNFIWLTVFFGEAPKPAEASGVKMHNLLTWNGRIQPCQFYITEKGNLMMGMAVDNRNVNAVVMKKWIDKIVDDSVRSQEAWANGGK